MNYYEHHLGDYMRDTAHLSLLEDGAYRRLLDAYYVREKPLPLDLRECCKLARASSKAERDAVAYVLREFFTLGDDGYRQGRADKEIGRFRAKSEKARASINARWGRTKNEAAAKYERTTDVANDAYERTTDDIHRAPVPMHQTPVTSNQESTSVLSARAADPPVVIEPTEAARVCIALKAVGIAGVSPGNQRLRMLLEAGADLQEFLAFADKARQSAPGKEFPYILAAVEGERKRAASMSGTLARGRLPTKQEALEARNRAVAEEFLRGIGA